MTRASLATVLAVITLCAACEEPPAGPAASGPSASVAPLPSAPASAPAAAVVSAAQREKVQAFFKDVGARAVAAVDASTKAGAKSRAGYAEAMALSTPAAFFLHADLFDKHGLTLDLFDAAMQDAAFADEAVRLGMTPLQAKAATLEADLPKTDPADCERPTRRMVELAAEGPKTAGLRAALGPTFTECFSALPKHVTECIPNPTTKLDVASYDACVAKGAPPKPK